MGQGTMISHFKPSHTQRITAIPLPNPCGLHARSLAWYHTYICFSNIVCSRDEDDTQAWEWLWRKKPEKYIDQREAERVNRAERSRLTAGGPSGPLVGSRGNTPVGVEGSPPKLLALNSFKSLWNHIRIHVISNKCPFQSALVSKINDF